MVSCMQYACSSSYADDYRPMRKGQFLTEIVEMHSLKGLKFLPCYEPSGTLNYAVPDTPGACTR